MYTRLGLPKRETAIDNQNTQYQHLKAIPDSKLAECEI